MKAEQFDQNLRAAFSFIEKVLADPGAFPEHFVAFPLDSDALDRVLTTERRRIVLYLRDMGPAESLTSLAAALQRDPAAVSRDVHVLTDAGLVSITRKGKRRVITGTGKPIIIA